MIHYTKGNLLDAPVEALVNTVNEVGVMGKGIALMFREAYPQNYDAYKEASEAGAIQVGRMFVTFNPVLMGPQWIINFPTKRHWRHPSKMEWIREGLQDLIRIIHKHEIRSLALPPLGCGNGGLKWEHVRHEIEKALSALEGIDIIVYEPSSAYQNKPKRTGVDKLTPARALIAEVVRRYSVLGIECTNLEVQKLAWFLYRVIHELGLQDPLKLKFVAHKYGPYADNLRHLLDSLDGSYLHCDRRLGDAGPMDQIRFDESKREQVESYLKSDAAQGYMHVIERTEAIIDGFQSPLGMELLATVDWLLSQQHCTPTVEGLKVGLAEWPGGTEASLRKQHLFDERLLKLALEQLRAVASDL